MIGSIWRIVLRSRLVTIGFVLSAIGVGFVSVDHSFPNHWRDTIHSFTHGLPVVLPAVILVIAVWALAADSRYRLDRERRSHGLSIIRWRLLHCTLASGLVLAWAAVVLASTLAFTRYSGPQYNRDSWTVALALMAVQCVVLTLWAHALVHWLGALTGTMAGFVAYVAGVVISYLPDDTGVDLVRIITPTATLRVLRLGDFPGEPGVAIACGISLALWTLLAASVFATPAGPRKSRPPRSSPPRSIPSRWGPLAVGLALVCLAAGAVLPAAVTRQLPLAARPFLVLQTLGDAAPHQRAQQFLLALRTNPDGADRLSANGSARRTLGDFVWAYASIPPGTPFTIESVTVPHAAVEASGTPYALCLRWMDSTWKVDKIPEPGRPIGPSCGSA